MAKNTPKYRTKLGIDSEDLSSESNGDNKRVVAYLRVSAAKQEEKFGLQAQLADIETYAAYKGFNISEVFVDVFTGTVDSREHLDRLKVLLQAGKVEEVLIYDIGRLARDLMASESLYLEFRRHAKVTSVTERFADNIEGDLLRHIKQAFFHYDRAKMIQRMTSGKIQAVTKDGRWQGGFGLFGYRSIGDGQVRIVEEEAERVIALFELLAEGMTKPQIAQELNKRGIPTMTGKKWDNSSVANVVSNQGFYAGEETIWAGVEVERVAHEPILPAGLVERLQTALGRPPGTITVAEAAKMVGVTVQTIHRWQKFGLLEFITVAGKTSGRGRRAVYFLDPDQVKTMTPDRRKTCFDRPKPEPSDKLVRREPIKPEEQPDGTLTVNQAAERLHTSASTIRRMMEQGELDIVGQLFIRTSKAWLLSEAQVDAMPVWTSSGRQAGYDTGEDHVSKVHIPPTERMIRKGQKRGGILRETAV